MTVCFAFIGAKALYMLFIWLASAMAGSYLSGRKGYGEKPGLASSLLVPVLAPLVWLLLPKRASERRRR